MVDHLTVHNNFLVCCELCKFSLTSVDNNPCKGCMKNNARSGICNFIPVSKKQMHKIVDCAYETLLEKVQPNNEK